MKKVQLKSPSFTVESKLSLNEKRKTTGGYTACGVPETSHCWCERNGVWYEYCCGKDGCKNAFPEI